jgi:hypothetical protein
MKNLTLSLEEGTLGSGRKLEALGDRIIDRVEKKVGIQSYLGRPSRFTKIRMGRQQ